MNSYKLLFGILHPARYSLALSLLFSFFTVSANILLLGTSAWLIATAALRPELVVLSLAVVGVRFYGITRAVCRYVERYVSHHMAFQGLYALRLWFYKVLEPLAPAIFRQFGSGDMLGRIVGDIETLQFFYLRVLIPPVTALLITICMGIYVSHYSFLYLWLLLAAFVLAGILLPLLVYKHNEYAAKILLRRRGEIKEKLAEILNGMGDIVAFERRKEIKKSLIDEFREVEEYRYKIEKGNWIGEALFQWIMNSVMLLALIISIPLFQKGQAIYIAVFPILFQAYFESLQPLILALHYHGESKSAVLRLQEVNDHSPVVEEECKGIDEDAHGIIRAKNNPLRIKPPSILFEKMNFSYNGNILFKDFNLLVKAGEKVAIVGPSGSGKTTLFMLLSRFYDYEGRIFIGDKECKSMPLGFIREQICPVFQNTYLFHAHIEDNIRIGKSEATAEEINEAIRFALLDRYIENLPQGMKTMLGSGGTHISGGQRQRIALARAYLKNGPLLLLDEPLEGLDRITREKMYQSLRLLMKNKTVLYITHQLEGLADMDRIIFLEKGSIKEEGTYADLINRRGAFYRYVQISMDHI